MIEDPSINHNLHYIHVLRKQITHLSIHRFYRAHCINLYDIPIRVIADYIQSFRKPFIELVKTRK